MCGIVGILHRDHEKSVAADLLMAMADALSHRGPDDEGFFHSHSVGFGHRRLAVIDLSSGHQPMLDDERGLALVYNGEVYNYQEIRRELGDSRGHFTTNCDTEVLLRLASFSSFEWIEKLNGMFAFALWSQPLKTLLLVRDRLGIKPLYYVNLNNEFIFASEIKPLLQHPNVRKEVNVEHIPEYLMFRNICGEETFFRGIFEVPPGHAVLVPQSTLQPKIIKFWKEGERKQAPNYVDPSLPYKKQFESLLLEAVQYRLISDVPVGTYNSGGVDSSLVTALVRSITQTELHTFSVGFEEKSYDESAYAQLVANQLGTDHHSLLIQERDYVDTLEETLFHLEEPINHAHTVQLLLLNRFAKQYVTVVLTGEGSDELFGGYPRYRGALLSRYFAHTPKILSRNFLSFLQGTQFRRLTRLFEDVDRFEQVVTENARYASLNSVETLLDRCGDFPGRIQLYNQTVSKRSLLLDQLLYFDQRSYLRGLLNRLDKTSMASAVECRVPFLDYRLVEWSYLLPQRMKATLLGGNKRIVKQAAERWLPKAIVHRKKSGFGVPISSWLHNPQGLGRYLDVLTDHTFKEREYCDTSLVEQLIKEHLSGVRDHGEILWALINLELWWRTFISETTDYKQGLRRSVEKELQRKESSRTQTRVKGYR